MPKSINETELRRSYVTIEEAITFHKCLVDRTADAVCWKNYAFKKNGGIKILEEMLTLEKSANKRKEIKKNLEYWKANYNSIRKLVYQG